MMLRSASSLLKASGSATLQHAVPSALAATGPFNQQTRNLNLHEHFSHQIMRKYGVNTPNGGVADTVDGVRELAEGFNAAGGCVVKSQVLAGGRGKGHFSNGFQGGVHVVDSSEEAATMAENMLGFNLITKQTGAEGRPCNQLMVVEKVKIANEFYFAILMDRESMGPILVASSEGGMDIETVAANTPDKIIKTPVDINLGMTMETGLEIAQKLGFPDASQAGAADQMMRLYDMFLAQDAVQVEINPMALLESGEVMAMDAKLNFDDNAEYRQKTIFEMRDELQEHPLEVVAHEHDLNYIGLDGTIGCLVNGAGLAMATLDIISLFGGKPANFLDVGGGATAEQVEAAFALITSDPEVNVILVNIFGGIMRCDVIAQGVLQAAAKLDLKIPVVVRLQGTMVDEAKALIATSRMDIISTDDLDDAAMKACQISEMTKLAKAAGLDISVKSSKVPTKLSPGQPILLQT
jgi:succinyl-CoA synthetase beta subunit